MDTRKVLLFAMLVAGPLPGTLAVEGPLATRPQAFRPVTLEAGRPKFHISPDSRLARNEHPRCLLTKEDLDVLRTRLADARLAAEFRALQRQAGDVWHVDSGGWKHAVLGNSPASGNTSRPSAARRSSRGRLGLRLAGDDGPDLG